MTPESPNDRSLREGDPGEWPAPWEDERDAVDRALDSARNLSSELDAALGELESHYDFCADEHAEVYQRIAGLRDDFDLMLPYGLRLRREAEPRPLSPPSIEGDDFDFVDVLSRVGALLLLLWLLLIFFG